MRAILCSLAILPIGIGCGRDRLVVITRDAGQPCGPTAYDADTGSDVPPQTHDAQVPDTAQDLAASEAHPGVDVPGGSDSAAAADACVPLVCHDPTCDSRYCGKIGDGCGGMLDCGDDCPTAWTCEQGLCRHPPVFCMSIGCNGPSYDYCGIIGDGCGDGRDCGTCPKSGWQCVDSLCVGGPDVCSPASCHPPSGGQYCGTIGDGCGGTLACDCPAGWTCHTGLCIDLSGKCPKVYCSTPGSGRYCGTIGDGCGGIQDCGMDCPVGSACGQSRPNLCGDSALPDPPPAATPPLPPPPPPPPAPCLPPPPPPLPPTPF
jgi:hypothetical protein